MEGSGDEAGESGSGDKSSIGSGLNRFALGGVPPASGETHRETCSRDTERGTHNHHPVMCNEWHGVAHKHTHGLLSVQRYKRRIPVMHAECGEGFTRCVCVCACVSQRATRTRE